MQRKRMTIKRDAMIATVTRKTIKTMRKVNQCVPANRRRSEQMPDCPGLKLNFWILFLFMPEHREIWLLRQEASQYRHKSFEANATQIARFPQTGACTTLSSDEHSAVVSRMTPADMECTDSNRMLRTNHLFSTVWGAADRKGHAMLNGVWIYSQWCNWFEHRLAYDRLRGVTCC